MADLLDLSLDDIIKQNRASGKSAPGIGRGGGEVRRGGGGRGEVRRGGGGGVQVRRGGGGRGDVQRGGGGGDFTTGPGPARNFASREAARPSPYYVPVPQPAQMKEVLIAKESGSEEGTRLYISNLDYNVTNDDIKVLFSDVGDLKRYSIHYDRSGRSKGTAEVVYVHHQDALAAIKRYHDIQLDGRPMKLELVGVKIYTPVSFLPTNQSTLPNPAPSKILYKPPKRQESTGGRVNNIVGAGGGKQNYSGGGFNGRGQYNGARGHGQGKGRPKVSLEDLDADLENYRLMQLD